MLLETATFGGPPLIMGTPDGDAHRKYNYKLCGAIDIQKLSVIFEEMIKNGYLHPKLAKIYKAQAESLLAALLSENNRAFDV